MYLPMFETEEQRASWCNRQADAIESYGLANAKAMLENAEEQRESFLKVNNISADRAEQEWAHHIEWLKGEVKYLTNQVKKYRKMARG